MPEITIHESGLVRLLKWARALNVVRPDPDRFNAGAEFGSDVAIPPRVDPLDEMSAYALAWVYICVQTCAADVAGLPRYVERNGEPLWDHPALDLLNNPRRNGDPVRYHRQRWADWYLSGNAYDLMLRPAPGAAPVSLQRLHPAKVTHVTSSNGDVRAYEYATGGAPVHYMAEDVIACSDISYETGPDGTRGVSRIRALMKELSVDLKALELAGQSVSRGSPAFLVRPAESEDRWDQEQVGAIAKSINRMLASVAGGALVMGGRTEVTPLGFSPRDVEYIQQREATRQTILSAFRIPPTIAGLPGANYATAEKEAESYWTARMADAALRDSADSRLAEILGQPGDRIVTDFSGIPALQADRTERLNRAQQLWIMGVPLKSALEAEGLGDIEVPEAAPPPAPAPPAEPRGVTLWRAPRTSDQRRTEWRSWEDSLRGPAEKRLAAAMTRHLREQAERMARRTQAQLSRSPEDVPVNARTFSAADLVAILDESGELARLLETAGPLIDDALRRAVEAMARRLGVSLSEQDAAAAAREAIEGSLEYVSRTSSEAVSRAIRDGLTAGEGPTQIADRVRRASAFSPSRALMISRTEVTRAMNAGAVATIEQAKDNGSGVTEIEWAAADGEARDSHLALDGQRVSVGEPFRYNGLTAKGPGDWGTPAMDANCRCTVLPVFDD